MHTVFGSGTVYGTPLVDAYGNAISNPTPVLFGVLQDVSVDISFDIKELYGSKQFPIEAARGKGKISCKAKFAQINGLMLNSTFFGQGMTTGGLADFKDSTGAAIPATPYTITPTIPNSGTWLNDLGVTDGNGVSYTRVVSSPTTGQYSVSAGVYTFAAADTTKTVFINFQYTTTGTTAKTITLNNIDMGSSPKFIVDLFNNHEQKQLSMRLWQCTSNKLGLSTKLDDFGIPEMDFMGMADSQGRVLSVGTAE